MRNLILKLLLIAIMLGSIPAYITPSEAQNILLAPTRVVLEGRKRKERLLVSNPSDAPVHYRVTVVNRRMLEDGSYVDIEQPMEDERFADQMVRISPRSFTVDSRSSQTVRIHARKPKGLEEGEYRSHIRVQAVPEATPAVPVDGDKLQIQVRVNVGMTIPLIVRHGNELAYKVAINDVAIHTPEGSDKPHLKALFTREGQRSSFGDISVLYTNEQGEEYLLKFLPGLSIFYPNRRRIFDFPLDIPEGVTISKGSIKVVYREQDDEGGNIIAARTQAL